MVEWSSILQNFINGNKLHCTWITNHRTNEDLWYPKTEQKATQSLEKQEPSSTVFSQYID